jgi:hypothetical protein
VGKRWLARIRPASTPSWGKYEWSMAGLGAWLGPAIAPFRLQRGIELMSVSSSVNITELIDRYPLGPLQIRIIVLCALVALLDGFDLLVIGAAAPAMALPLHIAPKRDRHPFQCRSVRAHARCIWAWTYR